MTVEDRLREVLRARADAVVPAQPEWTRVAERLGRRRRRRPIIAGTPVLVAFAVLMTAVIVWVQSDSDGSRPLRTAGPSPMAGAPTTSMVPPPAVPDLTGGAVPPGFRPMSVTWISSLHGWVLGDSPCPAAPCQSLLRTTDGGATWTGGPAPRAGARSGVRFADARNGWVYGEELWATHDAGSTWSRVVDVRGEVSSLESSEDRAWAVVNSGGAASVYSSAVGTDDWRPAGSNAVKGFGGVVLQGSGGYVVGPDESVLALSPGGLDRRGAPCRGPFATVGSLAPAGSDLFALCVDGSTAGSSTKTLLVSSDGARTWSTAGTPPRAGTATGLAAASRSTIVVWAAAGTSLLYRSDDGGATWATVHEDATRNGEFFHDLGFTSASRGTVMLGSPPGGVLLRTSDGGRTWSPVAFRS